MKNTFNTLVETIEEINAIDFFYSVASCITITDTTNNKTKEISTRIVYDVAIDITITDNAIVAFDHYLTSDCFEEYKAIWDKEITNRGLSYSGTELITQLKNDYSVLKFSAPNIKEIKDTVMGLFTLQKLVHFILRNRTLPMPVWNNAHPDYDTWYNYYNLSAITAGLLDGLIDELTTIPNAIVSLYEMAANPNKEEAIIANFYEQEVSKGLVALYRDEYNLNQVMGEYRACKAFISAGSMLTDNIETIVQ